MKYETVLRVLTEVCLLGVTQNKAEKVLPVEKALRALLLEDMPLRMSIAMGHLGLGQFEEAEKIVVNVLEKDTENFYAKAVFGFVLQAAGKDGWQEQYELVLSQSTDNEARNLARQGLSLIN
jgi:Tfp pilus assembly protein PilF